MFGMPEDRRTELERNRDVRRAEKRETEIELALGFLQVRVMKALAVSGVQVGIASKGRYGGTELLVIDDDVTYKIEVSVAN